MIIRIHTIRETSFISSGYLIAELTTMSLAIGLILAKIDPFYESLFFTGVIVFLCDVPDPVDQGSRQPLWSLPGQFS